MPPMIVSPKRMVKKMFKDEKALELCGRVFILIAFMDMDAIENEDVYDEIKELLIGIRFCC